MKKMILMAMMMAMTITANAMSYNKAKGEALFLSDKMAYELNLTAAQYEAVYEINLDYLLNVNGRNDVYGRWWNRRNNDLMYVLTAWQYNKYVKMNYFYRPIAWVHDSWSFTIYNHYSNRNHFYNVRPKAYGHYMGGNSQRGDRFYADKMADKHHGHANHNDLMAQHNTHSNGRGGSNVNAHATGNRSTNANAHRSVRGGGR